MKDVISYYTPVEILILGVLYANDAEPLRGKLWLQKIVFILDRNIEEINAIFDGYKIGPYSEKVDLALEQFRGSDYIIIDKNYKIYLTSKGIEIAKQAYSLISKKRRKIIDDVKKFMNSLTRIELIAFIYSSFPEMTEDSDIKNEFERTRFDASISLLKKNKVSLEKAAEIAGYPLSKYLEKIKNLHIYR